MKASGGAGGRLARRRISHHVRTLKSKPAAMKQPIAMPAMPPAETVLEDDVDVPDSESAGLVGGPVAVVMDG